MIHAELLAQRYRDDPAFYNRVNFIYQAMLEDKEMTMCEWRDVVTMAIYKFHLNHVDKMKPLLEDR